MKTVIRIKEKDGLTEHLLTLSEVKLISKILQESPDTIFEIQLLRISWEYYNKLFQY